MIVMRCTACTKDYPPNEVLPAVCTQCGSSSSFCQINLPDEFTAAADAMVAELPPDASDDDKKEAARWKMLGSDKGPGVCSQLDCHEQATHRFTWPGNPERLACPLHASAAVRIADAMGFFLEVPALTYDDAPPATPRDMPER